MERFTISLDDKLAHDFDAWAAQRGYENRSEAFRDMVRAEMDRERVQAHPEGLCVACLSYVYNHHERDLAERLAHLQHEHHDLTLSTMRAPLDHEYCLETVLLRGEIALVQAFSGKLCAQRGVQHGHLNLISVELHQPHVHDQAKTKTKAKPKPHLHIKPL